MCVLVCVEALFVFIVCVFVVLLCCLWWGFCVFFFFSFLIDRLLFVLLGRLNFGCFLLVWLFVVGVFFFVVVG